MTPAEVLYSIDMQIEEVTRKRDELDAEYIRLRMERLRVVRPLYRTERTP